MAYVSKYYLICNKKIPSDLEDLEVFIKENLSEKYPIKTLNPYKNKEFYILYDLYKVEDGIYKIKGTGKRRKYFFFEHKTISVYENEINYYDALKGDFENYFENIKENISEYYQIDIKFKEEKYVSEIYTFDSKEAYYEFTMIPINNNLEVKGNLHIKDINTHKVSIHSSVEEIYTQSDVLKNIKASDYKNFSKGIFKLLCNTNKFYNTKDEILKNAIDLGYIEESIFEEFILNNKKVVFDFEIIKENEESLLLNTYMYEYDINSPDDKGKILDSYKENISNYKNLMNGKTAT